MANTKIELSREVTIRERIDYLIWINDVPSYLNKECYFCGFSEFVEAHHITPKLRNGSDNKQNLLPLCRNCHYLLHKKHYYLENWGGFWVLRKDLDVFIFPTEQQFLNTIRFPDEDILIKEEWVVKYG